MTMRTACFTAGAAALALPAIAGNPKNLTLQMRGPGEQVQPIRACQVQIVDGQLQMTTDWVQLGDSQRGPATKIMHWDAFEAIQDRLDPGYGVPTDDAGAGCTGFLPVGYRWFFGATYNNPFVSNDMTDVVPGDATKVWKGWNWNGDGAGGALQCYIAVFTTEDWLICDGAGGGDDGTASAYPGVIYDFGVLAPGAGYYYTNIDLDGTTLFHTMPADGSGGEIEIFAMAFDGTTLTLAPQAQPMLWGTGEDEPGPSIRIGTQDFATYDDDAPTDGVHDLIAECYDYTFGVCPDPLCAMTAFLSKETGGCTTCLGDVNGDGVVDISDLALVLSNFGGPIFSDCLPDVDGDGLVGLSELATFLGLFGTIC